MSEDLLTRVPPQSLEAEQSVLGAILIENEAINETMGWLAADAFYAERNRVIYAAMLELTDRGQPIDAITLSEALKAKNQLERIGGMGYVAEIAGIVPSAKRIAHYAGIVRDKAVLRNIASTATEIASSAYDNPAEVKAFADDAAHRMGVATDTTAQSEVTNSTDLVRQALRAAEDAMQRGGMITGLQTGFIDLDNLTAGLQPANLIVIAARPSRGKTALGLNIAANVAYRENKNVLFFSLEMSKDEIGLRLLCAESHLPMQKIRGGRLSPNDFPRLATALDLVSRAKGKIEVNDESALTPLQVKAIARRMHRQEQLSLIVIDYLQLMTANHRDKNSREREVAEITKSLKGLAKELKIPVLALAQLNRQTESRQGGRPTLADLRESGEIEQSADIVAFIHDPEAYKPKDQRDKDAPRELIVAKQRNGPTGDINLTWLGDCTRFENYSAREEI